VVAATLLGLVVLPLPHDGSGRARLLGPASAPVVREGAPDGCAAEVAGGMTTAQRAGQVLMAGVPAGAGTPGDDVTAALRQGHVGSVYLRGRTDRGAAATARLTADLRALAPPGTGLHIAVDQEGGAVQVLRGPGFSDLPPAVEQGRLPTQRLRSTWRQVGDELSAAGITMNLAPVADAVPAGRPNRPIGDHRRQFGADPAVAGAAVVAMSEGLTTAGVTPVVKHFPGLGRADGNTDVDPNVSDAMTGHDDPFVRPFRDAVEAGVPVVMLSSARYPRLDPVALGVFSPDVVGVLHEDLGFRGVIMTDDLGRADAVAGVPVGSRAVDAVAAGVDLVLVFDADDAVVMARALTREARRDPALAARLLDAATRVVHQKSSVGLVPGCGRAGARGGLTAAR
jgi:beta-N-acetylhexosaminidase